jgi:hypothetical protein
MLVAIPTPPVGTLIPRGLTLCLCHRDQRCGELKYRQGRSCATFTALRVGYHGGAWSFRHRCLRSLRDQLADANLKASAVRFRELRDSSRIRTYYL